MQNANPGHTTGRNLCFSIRNRFHVPVHNLIQTTDMYIAKAWSDPMPTLVSNELSARS